MCKKIPKSMLFRACLYPSPDIQGYFVAHCLELDVIGEGDTPEKALIELVQAIEIQIENCTNATQFLFPAPASVWKRYKDSVNAGRAILKRIVEQVMEKLPASDYTPYFENVGASSTIPEEYVTIN